MVERRLLAHAIEIAQEAHRAQLDKVGEPYFEHCRRVAEQVTSADEKTVAYLHDVVEKTRAWSIERLQAEGFPDDIIDAVRALTRTSSESDDCFVRRAMSNKLARGVKVADLNDNLVQVLQVDGDIERLGHELAVAKAELMAT